MAKIVYGRTSLSGEFTGVTASEGQVIVETVDGVSCEFRGIPEGVIKQLNTVGINTLKKSTIDLQTGRIHMDLVNDTKK